MPRRLWFRIVLFTLAWGAFAVSLPAPAFDIPAGTRWLFGMVQDTFGGVPMGLVLLICLVNIGRPTLLLLPVTLLFLSPLTLIPAGRLVTVIGRVAAFGLFGVWVLPVAYYTAKPPPGGWSALLWGYYLFAGAHTLAFVAVQVGPPGRRRTDRRPGFPVVTDKGARIH